MLVASACAVESLAAQASTLAIQDSAVRVFLDCPDTFCDFDYQRTEITFVNWVRDRLFAQVHVLITTQLTAGGREYTMSLIGAERFAGTIDTLRWTSRTSDSQDDTRRTIAQELRLGLVRFAAKTPVGRRLEISYHPAVSIPTQVHDPWHNWVFSAAVNGNLNGERTVKSRSWFGSISASKITETWKLRFSVSQNYTQSDFTFPVFDSSGTQVGEQNIRSITRGNEATSLVVRSVGAHWAVGVSGLVFSSTYYNENLVLGIAPALEYDVVPYAHSTRRLLTIRYELGPTAYWYRDTTLFNKLREALFKQAVNVALNVKEPWGSAGVALQGSNYLHDFRKNRLTIFANGDFRIYKGLSFSLFGNVGLVHDQLFIPKAGASEQEVLLRVRQLATSYQYFCFFTLSYTFGSKFANIVNARFEGGGGGFLALSQ